MTTRDSQAGFTLIEALVAMAVLALGAVSLLSATEGHTARITALTDRIGARWVAETRLTELRLGLDTPATVRMMNRDWAVTETVSETTDSDLARVTVTVAPGETPDSPLAILSSYLPAADLPESAP